MVAACMAGCWPRNRQRRVLGCQVEMAMECMAHLLQLHWLAKRIGALHLDARTVRIVGRNPAFSDQVSDVFLPFRPHEVGSSEPRLPQTTAHLIIEGGPGITAMQQDQISPIPTPDRPVPYPHVETMGRRIEVAMRTGRTNASDLACAIGMNHADLFLVLEGKVSALPPAKLLALASRLNVSQAWLVGGDGPMNSQRMGGFSLKPGQDLASAFDLTWSLASASKRP